MRVQGQLVDLKTGTTLWQRAAQASSSENQQQQQGGLAAVLISAVIKHEYRQRQDLQLACQVLRVAHSHSGQLVGLTLASYEIADSGSNRMRRQTDLKSLAHCPENGG